MNIATSQAEHAAQRIARGEDPQRVIEAAIHAALIALVGPLTPLDYATRTGITIQAAYAHLRRLTAIGALVRKSQGVYEVSQ